MCHFQQYAAWYKLNAENAKKKERKKNNTSLFCCSEDGETVSQFTTTIQTHTICMIYRASTYFIFILVFEMIVDYPLWRAYVCTFLSSISGMRITYCQHASMCSWQHTSGDAWLQFLVHSHCAESTERTLSLSWSCGLCARLWILGRGQEQVHFFLLCNRRLFFLSLSLVFLTSFHNSCFLFVIVFRIITVM